MREWSRLRRSRRRCTRWQDERESNAWVSPLVFLSPTRALDARKFTRASRGVDSTLPKFHEVQESVGPPCFPGSQTKINDLSCAIWRGAHMLSTRPYASSTASFIISDRV